MIAFRSFGLTPFGVSILSRKYLLCKLNQYFTRSETHRLYHHTNDIKLIYA
jgi:hypothetical protein